MSDSLEKKALEVKQDHGAIWLFENFLAPVASGSGMEI